MTYESDNDNWYRKPLEKIDVELITDEQCGLPDDNQIYFCTSGDGEKGSCVRLKNILYIVF